MNTSNAVIKSEKYFSRKKKKIIIIIIIIIIKKKWNKSFLNWKAFEKDNFVTDIKLSLSLSVLRTDVLKSLECSPKKNLK